MPARFGNDEMPDKVRWIRVVHAPDGRISAFCIYDAVNGEAVREHARKIRMPGEEFCPVATTVIVLPAPADTMAKT